MPAKKNAPCRLKDLGGVAPAHVEKLAGLGIKTADQMLRSGRTRADRAALALETGIRARAILELVKLSDLARLPGVQGARARLYFDAGIDCVEKVVAWDPEPLRLKLERVAARNGFEGGPPLPREVSSTIAVARRLPLVVEW
jgi:hypothetical protein